MKSLIYLMLPVLLFACNNPAEDTKMRRFTFAAYNASDDTLQIKNISLNNELQQTLRKSGVVNYNYCTVDTISFLVLDMDRSFNLDMTRKLFNKLSVKYPQMSILTQIIGGDNRALKRIYKMDQKEVFSIEEGQLIPMHKNEYARFVLTLEIINDSLLAEDYIAVHGIGKAWPEITQNMKTVGIHEMELYLIGFRAFLIMDTKPDFDWNVDGEKWGTLPREKEWQAHVAKFQKTDPESKAAEKWKTMQIISAHP